jgi:hypothetical protein
MNSKLMAAAIVGSSLLGAAGLGFGVYALTREVPLPEPEAAVEELVEPVASPDLAPALATVERTQATTQNAPAPAPEPESYEPELDTSGPVRVRRLVVSTGIDRREPVGVSDVFTIGEQRRLYAFVEAVNESDAPVELRVTFEPERGESAGHIELEVPAEVARWRTWAYTQNVVRAGRWEAVVRDSEGHVIARRPFDVEE